MWRRTPYRCAALHQCLKTTSSQQPVKAICLSLPSAVLGMRVGAGGGGGALRQRMNEQFRARAPAPLCGSRSRAAAEALKSHVCRGAAMVNQLRFVQA